MAKGDLMRGPDPIRGPGWRGAVADRLRTLSRFPANLMNQPDPMEAPGPMEGYPMAGSGQYRLELRKTPYKRLTPCVAQTPYVVLGGEEQ